MRRSPLLPSAITKRLFGNAHAHNWYMWVWFYMSMRTRLAVVHVLEFGRAKMAAILLGDRRLTDLKVTELKAELDKRGLPKKGVKSVLVERLKKAILREELSNVSRPSLRLFCARGVTFPFRILLWA